MAVAPTPVGAAGTVGAGAAGGATMLTCTLTVVYAVLLFTANDV